MSLLETRGQAACLREETEHARRQKNKENENPNPLAHCFVVSAAANWKTRLFRKKKPDYLGKKTRLFRKKKPDYLGKKKPII